MPKFPELSPVPISVDALLVIPPVALLAFGGIALYSTGQSVPLLDSSFFRQAVWLVISLAAVWTLRYVHPRMYFQHAYRLYAVFLLLLVFTFFMPAVSGGQRWIMLGPFSMQPSELGKIVLVLALAKYLTDYRKKLNEFPYAVAPIGFALVPAMLIVAQPDLGTALIYLAIAFTMSYWANVPSFYLFVIVAPIVSIISGFQFYAFSLWMAVLVLVLAFAQVKLRWKSILFALNALFGTLTPGLWNSLQPYQQRRIMTLIDATSDPHGTGYQVLQSRTAIGSGGLFGKGLGEGTQTHLRFLPVTDTDFIAAVIGEELGFIAILVILILFGWLLLRMLDRASTTQYRFASLSVVGFASIILVHAFVNLGMVTGLMPVTGLPLPFLSYGGSFLLTCILTIGMTHYLLAGEPV